ncbi:dehydrogenase, partial [Streptomyces sp. NPDC006324]
DTGLVEREAEGLVPKDVPAEVYAAAAAVRLATVPDDGPTGRFFDDGGEVPW